jgi:hypothetical protein
LARITLKCLGIPLLFVGSLPADGGEVVSQRLPDPKSWRGTNEVPMPWKEASPMDQRT